ncbi:immunity 22 family protein [Lysobacter sp. cf310]|uniref:immunity 22 family protein n=1 Tax=Lysobacter sp. cf310 TaxID=1761790 RepID=UPI0008F12DDF|nr:immunity 22 family protein [Lysobacter sp. cf310]SFK92790.1 Immunity protein 22 [Lysobacter sp. cf310]
MSAVERMGVVSLWGGRFASEDDFFSYVEKTYPDSGATSGFIRDSGIGFYDEDFAEGNYFTDGGVESAIRELSYGDTFPPKAVEAMSRVAGANSIYAIYDVDATELRSDADRLVFVGAFTYSK